MSVGVVHDKDFIICLHTTKGKRALKIPYNRALWVVYSYLAAEVCPDSLDMQCTLGTLHSCEAPEFLSLFNSSPHTELSSSHMKDATSVVGGQAHSLTLSVRISQAPGGLRTVAGTVSSISSDAGNAKRNDSEACLSRGLAFDSEAESTGFHEKYGQIPSSRPGLHQSEPQVFDALGEVDGTSVCMSRLVRRGS